MEFKNESGFLHYLQDLDKDTEFVKCRIRDIRFIESKKVDTSCFSLEDLRACTEDTSGLWVVTKKNEFPVKKKAVKSFCSCIGISGTALKHLSPADLRMVLNKCAKGNDRQVWIRADNGAADSCVKEEPHYLLARYKEIKNKLPGCVFRSAVDHGNNIVLSLAVDSNRYVYSLDKK